MNKSIIRPLQCYLWKMNELTPEDLSGNFDTLKTFVDTEHYMTRILRCKECGQLYYFEYYEHIDWLTGNDPQHCTYIPIDSEWAAEDVQDMLPIELLQFSPRLQSDWPVKEGEREVRWVGR